MTKGETAKIMAYFRELYPNGPKVTAATVNAWHTVLGEYPYRAAWECAVELAKEWDGYTMPPPAALAKKMRMVASDDTAVGLWREAEKLIKRGTVLTEEEYQAAPEPIKAYFGGRSAVRDLALLDITAMPNERARFLRHIGEIVERTETRNALTETALKQIGGDDGSNWKDKALPQGL